MAKKRVFAAVMMLVVFCIGEQGAADEGSPDFHKRLHRAQMLVLKGDMTEGVKAFEMLLKDNPGNPLVYEAYGFSLEAAGEYDAAMGMAAQMAKANPMAALQAHEMITRFRKKKEFEEKMKMGVKWEDAVSFGSQDFHVRTNIPREYYLLFSQRFPKIIDDVSRMLEDVLGSPEREGVFLEVMIAGGSDAYDQALSKHRHNEYQDFGGGSYNAFRRTLIVYFEGFFDWHLLTFQTAHALLRQRYMANPSELYSEGLSLFVANKLEKLLVPNLIHSQILFFNWRYDNGFIHGIKDIFEGWKRREAAIRRGAHLGYVQEYDRMFQNDAWSLVQFLAAADDTEFAQFWQDWTTFEGESSKNNYVTLLNFFDTKLSREGVSRMGNAWLDYMLNLTYADV